MKRICIVISICFTFLCCNRNDRAFSKNDFLKSDVLGDDYIKYLKIEMSILEIDQYDEAFRFYKLYSFQSPSVITIYRTNNEWYVSTSIISRTLMPQFFGDDPKILSYDIETSIANLDKSIVDSFFTGLKEKSFYRYHGKVSGMPGFDGNTMLFEYWKSGAYYYFEYWDSDGSPENKNIIGIKDEFDKLKKYMQERKAQQP